MRWLAQRRFSVLLVVQLLLIVGGPLSRAFADLRLPFDFFLALVFVCALFLVYRHPSLRLTALLLGVPPLVVQWYGFVLPDASAWSASFGLHLLASLFLSFTLVVVLSEVVAEKRISLDGICGALCGYLLIGLIFSHLYSCVDFLLPASFSGNPELTAARPKEPDRHLLFMYFSFITLTTVGYGDIVPARTAVRGLVVAEAVIGQFYLAVLIADLVGKKLTQSAAPPEAP
jgi:hypothetical protein